MRKRRTNLEKFWTDDDADSVLVLSLLSCLVHTLFPQCPNPDGLWPSLLFPNGALIGSTGGGRGVFRRGVTLRRLFRFSPNFQKGLVVAFCCGCVKGAASPVSRSRFSWLPKVIPATLMGKEDRRSPNVEQNRVRSGESGSQRIRYTRSLVLSPVLSLKSSGGSDPPRRKLFALTPILLSIGASDCWRHERMSPSGFIAVVALKKSF